MWKPKPAQETLMELEPVWEWERTPWRFLQSSPGMFHQAVLETEDQATWTLCQTWHGNFYLPRMKLCIFLPNIYTICTTTGEQPCCCKTLVYGLIQGRALSALQRAKTLQHCKNFFFFGSLTKQNLISNINTNSQFDLRKVQAFAILFV